MNHVEDHSPGRCRQCGKPVDTDRMYCAQCTIERAEEAIPEPVDPLSFQPDGPRIEKRILAPLIILLVCLAIMAFRMPALIAAFEQDRPLRQGTYKTDSRTDQCIENLWRLARLLQDGQETDETLVCPASGRAYIITREGDNIAARCPNPGLHGVGQITVSTNSPMPEVKP